jgi:hypothetical protein
MFRGSDLTVMYNKAYADGVAGNVRDPHDFLLLIPSPDQLVLIECFIVEASTTYGYWISRTVYRAVGLRVSTLEFRVVLQLIQPY